MSILAALAALAALSWSALLLFWGGFWRADVRLADRSAASDPARAGEEEGREEGGETSDGDDHATGSTAGLAAWPEVTAVIPARDEADHIAEVLRSHAATRYPGVFSVVLVDDGSSDGTGDAARAVAAEAARPMRVIDGAPLAEGWTGKLWALETGLKTAHAHAPNARFILLTDADIVHAPDTLERLVLKAEREDRALVSLMARLDARGFWGRLLTPAFVFFFQKLYPFPLIAQPSSWVAGAAGGCVLVRRAALEAIGGVGAVRGALIDDCSLAAKIKAGPPRRSIWLGLADEEVVSRRDNRALESVWRMVTRTAYPQLRRNPALLVGAVLGMLLLYLSGPAAVLSAPFHGDLEAMSFGALAWGLSAVAYWPTARLYGGRRWEALGLPAAAALYTAMTVDSAMEHHRGRGGAWKGRTYSKTG